MRFLFFLLLALVTYSCGDSAPETTATEAEQTEAAEEATEAMTARTEGATFLNNTIQAVRDAGGDLTALPAEAAAANVNGWIGRLSRMEGTDEIVGNLSRLQTEFQIGEGEELNGESISAILTELANNTRQLAGDTPGLETLADALEAGAVKLAE